ncbi:efflux RND transporter periplasmic adaptor subunit [Kutzneria sp. NPDC052558]|uniref:efflux RND transporter periplasmic adaptor subunit n=1 Tax=Kutzneria sp. NPDC052558 TaxID=3364121 RepID=UPI0037CBDB49
MRTTVLACVCAAALLTAACSAGGPAPETPGLVARDTTMTTVKPAHQDLSNQVSLTGKVALDPVFGVPAPADGQVRYLDVKQPDATPATATPVANVWANGKATRVDVPAGSTFSGRLVDDKSTVTAGMPVASAKYAGYGIVADLDGSQAYRIASAPGTVQAQIKDGPGPFQCTVLGTIAALPAGTPAPPSPTTAAQPPKEQQPSNIPAPPGPSTQQQQSDPTGLRLVCTPPAGVKMINGVTATLQVVTAIAQNVLTLPVEAVAGSQGSGKVDVVVDGRRQTKDVTLGLTDGKVVEIKTGLTGDETVAVPGPNLPQPQQQAGGPTR